MPPAENFIGGPASIGIKTANTIVSARGNGKGAYVATQDIAQAIVNALATKEVRYTEQVVVGPHLYTMDDIVGLFTEILDRESTHTSVTDDERMVQFVSMGLPHALAEFLAGGETKVRNGLHAELAALPGTYKGMIPLREFLEQHKGVFIS